MKPVPATRPILPRAAEKTEPPKAGSLAEVGAHGAVNPVAHVARVAHGAVARAARVACGAPVALLAYVAPAACGAMGRTPLWAVALVFLPRGAKGLCGLRGLCSWSTPMTRPQKAGPRSLRKRRSAKLRWPRIARTLAFCISPRRLQPISTTKVNTLRNQRTSGPTYDPDKRQASGHGAALVKSRTGAYNSCEAARRLSDSL